MKNILRLLYRQTNKQKKIFFFFTIILSCLSSIFEVVSIGIVIPFITYLTKSNDNFINLPLPYFGDKIISVDAFFFLFFIVILTSLIVRLLSIHVNARFSFSFGNELSTKAFHTILHRSYREHKLTNSSEDISKVVIKVNTIIRSLLFPFISLVSAITMTLVMAAISFLISPKLTMIIATSICSIYFSISYFFKKKLQENSKEVAKAFDKEVQLCQENIGGIKDIILNNGYDFALKEYSQTDSFLRNKQVSTILISQSPRFLIESMAISFLVLGTYYITAISGDYPKEAILPTLIAMAVALQRFLPIAQQAYRSWANIEGNKESIIEVFSLFDKSQDDLKLLESSKEKEKLNFNHSIEVKNVSFNYNEKVRILDNVSLKIEKGMKVGIIGNTGSGKSTFLDILTGLLPASSGNVLVDGVPLDQSNVKEWFQHISHVPQHIHLIDNCFYHNICFPNAFDEGQKGNMEQASKMAQADDFIKDQPYGYDTVIGENGKRLSGGQRQRIGIARCLFNIRPVIILDEATSALDTKTESRVMNSIYSLKDTTVFIIAHRTETLRKCDLIIDLKDGHINRMGNYESFFENGDFLQ